MFSDAWFMAAPRVCASPATSISRNCRFTTSTELISSVRNAAGRAHQPNGASPAKTRSRTAIPIDDPSSDPKTDRSARIPATQVPTTMPRPNASRNTGTAAAGSPPTSVTVGAM